VAVADEQYLCVPDQTTGFAFDKRAGWQGQNLNASDTKYLVRRSKPDDPNPANAKWLVFELGQKAAFAECSRDFSSTGSLSCSGFGVYEWRLNKNNMRFLLAYLAGYTNGADNNDDTPSVTIGKCAPL
jgi:hypothetical protein